MQRITIEGKPILWNHEFPIGKVERSWLDDEGWLNAAGAIYMDTREGRVAAHEVENGTRNALSLVHDVKGYKRIVDEPGYYERKQFHELSLVRPTEARRPGCLVRKGRFDGIEGRERITDPGAQPRRTPADPLSHARSTMSMKPEDQAALELKLAAQTKEIAALQTKLEEAKGFDAKYAAQESQLTNMQMQLTDMVEREKRLIGEVEAFNALAREQLDERATSVKQLLGGSPEANAVVDDVRTLATDRAATQKMDSLFELVEVNMRGMTPDDARATVEGHKTRMMRGAETDDFFQRNRKRFRSTAPAASAAAAAAVTQTASLRDLAILNSVEQDRKERGFN
jgi:hypothetical protein